MRRPAYRHAVQWIADNDEPTILDPLIVQEMISVGLVADLWHKQAADVADDVVRTRVEDDQ
jgi:hypothetical protein